MNFALRFVMNVQLNAVSLNILTQNAAQKLLRPVQNLAGSVLLNAAQKMKKKEKPANSFLSIQYSVSSNQKIFLITGYCYTAPPRRGPMATFKI